MTCSVSHTHGLSACDSRSSLPLGEAFRRDEFRADRKVIVHVAEGLDGVLRVAMMLRGRRYRVRDLAMTIREGALSEIRVTVVLTASETELLLNRLRRFPIVVSADNT